MVKALGQAVGLTALLLGPMVLAGAASAASLAISVRPFGAMPDGQAVSIYRLENKNGIEVNIITYGGAIQSIMVPDRNGRLADVALGFDNLEGYLKSDAYFGALIGRYANRIAKGNFTLNGKTYNLPTNNPPNSLHGGTKGFDKQVWAASEIKTPDTVGVELTSFSPDGDMGYPGNLAITVRYTLDNDNNLGIRYSAVTDRPTVLNFTNHTYFNLAGAGSGTVLDQVAMIDADRITDIDDALIPTGKMIDVAGGNLGFTMPTPIGAHIHADNPQLKYAEPKQGGYDFNYVFNSPGDLHTLAASVTDPQSGRSLEMYTDQPGVQFYTSNYLDDVRGKDGKVYRHWGAFALEAQHFPDSPNEPGFPSTELKPGEKYRQTTLYKFRSGRHATSR